MVSGFHMMANNDFKPLNFFPFHSEKRPTFHSCSEDGCPHEIIGFSHCWLLQLVEGAGTKGLCPLCVLFVREEDIFQNRFPTSLWSEQGQMATTKPITGWIDWDCHRSVRQAKSPRVTPLPEQNEGVWAGKWLPGTFPMSMDINNYSLFQ